MVCKTCERKLGTITTPDTFKLGSKSTTIGSQGRKLNENKLLSKKSVSLGTKCKTCKKQLHQKGSNYCQECSYKKGICAFCGKTIMDIKFLKQSTY